VFVSFTPLLYLYKKDCSSVKASWTKKRRGSFEIRPNRLIPEHGSDIGPPIDTGLEDGFDRSRRPVLTLPTIVFYFLFVRILCFCPAAQSHILVLVFFLLFDFLPAHLRFYGTGKLNDRDGLASEVKKDDVRLTHRELSLWSRSEIIRRAALCRSMCHRQGLGRAV
jgi:hypothetical protein